MVAQIFPLPPTRGARGWEGLGVGGLSLSPPTLAHIAGAIFAIPPHRCAGGGKSPLDLGEIGYRAGRFADLIEKLEPVFAQGFVVDVDGDFVEEGIDGRP
jgi:hypothetical protein